MKTQKRTTPREAKPHRSTSPLTRPEPSGPHYHPATGQMLSEVEGGSPYVPKRSPRETKSTKPKQTVETINRRRRRRVVRAMAGAVIGGVIAGPLGVAAGAIVGASRKRGPKARPPAARPKSISLATPAKAFKSGKARAPKRRFISKPKKTTVNIYPPIP